MKKIRVGINGFGRIGRLFFRQAFDWSLTARKEGMPEIEIVAINDLGDIENLAYLLKHDSVYRTFKHPIKTKLAYGKHYLVVDEQSVLVFQEKDPAKLPWGDIRVDVVVEATGFFETFEDAHKHISAGAPHVVLTAPAKDEDGSRGKTILMGVNAADTKGVIVTSNASCTTNAVSPVIAVLSENPGIKKAVLNTVHGYTATQNLQDGPTKGKDFRRGRAAAENIVPSTTGAAIAVTRAIPSLAGKFDGIALRVPVPTGSIADITFVSKRKTTADEINEILKKAASSARWKGILKVSSEQLVSSDIIGEPYGAIVDTTFTKVIDGDLVKVLSWYDNEYGYVSTLVKHVLAVGKKS